MPLQLQQFEIGEDDPGTDDTVRHMLALIHAGAADPAIVELAQAICRRADPHDAYGQAVALRDWCDERWCFADDPDTTELLYAPETQLYLIRQHGCMKADCDDAAILFGTLGAAAGFPVRVICIAFLTGAAPYSHTWAEVGLPSETGEAWIEGDVTRPMQAIPIAQISRVGIWNDQGNFSEGRMAQNDRLPFGARPYTSPVRSAFRPPRNLGRHHLRSPHHLGFTIPGIGIDTNDISSVASLLGIGGGSKANPAAQSIATKWYVWGLRRQPGSNNDPGGLNHWIGRINTVGAAQAYQEFLSAPESIAKGMAQTMQLYQQLGYGAPTDDPGYAHSQVAPPTDETAEDFYGVVIGSPTSMPISNVLPVNNSPIYRAPTQALPRPTNAPLPATLAAPIPWGKIAIGAGVALGVTGIAIAVLRKRKRSRS